jgi:hypothetical protein
VRKLAFLLLLLPCWWQPRIEAGDLASHLYNAWLAQLVREGRAPGLSLASQYTNVLFDWLLSALFRIGGAGFVEHVAVSLAVAVFVSGAFAFLSDAIGGPRPWGVLPVIGALAYGWVFHMGFFNFYVALGLCFWALALCWHVTPKRAGAAAAVLAVAWLAHALPVAWAAGALIYRWLAPRVGEARMAAVGAAGICLLRVGIQSRMGARWFPFQFWRAAGIDQLWVFDDKYAIAAAGLALVWVLWAIEGRRSEARQPGRPMLMWLAGLTAFAVVVLPTVIAIPGYRHQIAYISDRMSLPLAVCVCAWLAPSRPGRWSMAAALALAALYGGFLLHDHFLLNEVEAEMARAVSEAPRNQRIVAPVFAPDLRVDPLGHMLDRICIGTCFSYGNYEPATLQFRVRVTGESPIVVSTIEEAFRIQTGNYAAKPRDVPLYGVTAEGARRFTVVAIPAGATLAASPLSPL